MEEGSAFSSWFAMEPRACLSNSIRARVAHKSGIIGNIQIGLSYVAYIAEKSFRVRLDLTP